MLWFCDIFVPGAACVNVQCCIVLLHLLRLSGCISESLLGPGF